MKKNKKEEIIEKNTAKQLVKTTSKRFNILIVCVLSLLFFGTVFTIFPVRYALNDDVQMMSMLSGRYTGEPSIHSVFILFPFTGFLSLLYKICNFIDWYALTFILFRIVFYMIAMYKIITKCQNTRTKIASCIISFILLWYFEGTFIYSITFTEVSVFIMLCVLIIFLLSENKKHEKVIITTGIILSFTIRYNACLMILPYMPIIGIYQCYGNKELFKKYVIFAIEIVLILGTILLTNMLIEKFSGWEEYNNYNYLRSQYYDFCMEEIRNLPEKTRTELYEKSNITEADLLKIENLYMRFRRKLKR